MIEGELGFGMNDWWGIKGSGVWGVCGGDTF